MMKKTLLAAAMFAATAAPAQAQEITMKPYVGFDLQRTNYSYNNNYTGLGVPLNLNEGINDGLNGINLHIGNRFHRNFGAEVGAFYNFNEDKDIAGLSSTEIRSFGFAVDGMGYVPLNDTVELIGTAGITWTKARFKYDIPSLSLSGSKSDGEFGLRGGAGAQFNLTPEVSLRALARCQTADFSDVAEHAWVYSAGLNYSF